MGARLRIILTKEEERTLRELGGASTVSKRVKARAEVIRLNHQGMYNEKIAKYIGWSERTVRKTVISMEKGRLRKFMGCTSSRSAEALARGGHGISRELLTPRATNIQQRAIS